MNIKIVMTEDDVVEACHAWLKGRGYDVSASLGFNCAQTAGLGVAVTYEVCCYGPAADVRSPQQPAPPDPTSTPRECRDVVVYVNGKMCCCVSLPLDASDDEVRDAVTTKDAFMNLTIGRIEKKFLFVPGKIIDVVMSELIL